MYVRDLMSRASLHFCDAGASVKFLQLFGKSNALPVRHVRQPATPLSAAAVETTRKIDAIESEISAEFGAELDAELGPGAAGTQENHRHDSAAAPIAQCIDEASLLYASRQPGAAEALLLEAVAQRSGGDQEPVAWMMLLELAIAADDPARFDSLAVRYAERFETSPPQWRNSPPTSVVPTALAPLLSFRGELNGNAAPSIERFAQMAAPHRAVRIDLTGATSADDDGCAQMLALLEQWLSEKRHIELLPAPGLAALLRKTLDDALLGNDNAWRLWTELLRCEGETSAYEEACIDYSIAREISPPAPLLPPRRPPLATPRSSGLLLPAEISWPVDALLESLSTQALAQPTIVLDCRCLQRVEFNAAAPLLAGVARLANGKPVEWRDLSYLVSTLLQLIGGAGCLRIVNRKP